MTNEQVLAILNGSPHGTTQGMFEHLGVTAEQMVWLVDAGHARTETRVMARPAMRVLWFFPIKPNVKRKAYER